MHKYKYANARNTQIQIQMLIAAQLPLTAIRPGFPAAALMAGAGQYG